LSVSWVIDSSIGIAWIHPHQATSETDNLLEQVDAGATIVVPSLWYLEMANSLLLLQRRKRITPDERKTALETLSAMVFTVDEGSSLTAFNKMSGLAEKYNLTIYDAAYLEVALRRKLPLASRDDALSRAAGKCGIKML
jgi:predicted nucleic acid-binding protein